MSYECGFNQRSHFRSTNYYGTQALQSTRLGQNSVGRRKEFMYIDRYMQIYAHMHIHTCMHTCPHTYSAPTMWQALCYLLKM